MMDSLVKNLSYSLLPTDQLNQEMDAVVPKEKQKGNQLPWVEVVKCLFNRAIDSSSEILFENVFKIIEVNLEKTVQRVLKNSKKDGHICCGILSSLVSHIQYSVEDSDLPMSEVNKLNVLLLSAVTDVEIASVRDGEEPAAVSRIYLKLTLMLGEHPEYILDTLLHCRTLLYSSARQPLIFVPLIKRIFTSIKNKSPQSPHLYLKYLLLGKLWLFMTKKEEVGKTRTYIVNSVRLPKAFVDWAVQNKIPWLKLSKWNSQLILRSMTVSSALKTLYGDDKPASSPKRDFQKSKKKKKENVNEAHDGRNNRGIYREVLQKKCRKDVSGRICDKKGNTKYKLKQKVLQNTHIEQEEKASLLTGKMKENIHGFDNMVDQKDEAKVRNKLDSNTSNINEEQVKTQGRKMLLDASDRKTKKVKIHEVRQEEREIKAREKKEDMVDTGHMKTLNSKSLEMKENSSNKNKKVILKRNNMKVDQFEVLDRRWKGKNSKNVEASICRKNEKSVGVEKQNQGSSDQDKVKVNVPRFFEHLVSESSLTVGMMARKYLEQTKQMPGGSHFLGPRKRKQSDQAHNRKICNTIPQVRRQSKSNQGVEKSSTSHVAAKVSKCSGKREQRMRLTKHKVAAIHKRIRRNSITFTVTDLEPVIINKKIKCEGRFEGDSEQGENKEINDRTANDLPKEKVGALASISLVNTEVSDKYSENDSKVYELLDCDSEMYDESYNSETNLPGEMHISENNTLNMSSSSKDVAVRVYNDKVNEKLDSNEASGMTGDGESELINETDTSWEELDRDLRGNDSEVRDESNSSGEELDGESDKDNNVVEDLDNQTFILHQEGEQSTEVMGRVTNKGGNSNENKAFRKAGDESEFESTPESNGEELDSDSNDDDDSEMGESNSSGKELDGESDIDDDEAEDLDNQTWILQQEGKQPTEVMGRVANKPGNSNENKALSKAGDEESDLENIFESSGEKLDNNSNGSDSEVEGESDGIDDESSSRNDGAIEVSVSVKSIDQEKGTVSSHQEVKQPTEKMATVIKESGELTKILETSNKSSIQPAMCAENSDSDIEILHVEEANPELSTVHRNKIIALKDHANDIDEASGSDSDIVPCDEKTKMFTDEETKNYHKKLMEDVLQRKVENILKAEERELKRKRLKDEKPKSIGPTVESHTNTGNSTDKETISKKDVGSKDLVSHMMNKFYKPSAGVKIKEEEEFFDLESDNDSDIEVVLQTIVKDTGRLTSICGLRERFLSSTVVKDESDENDDQQKSHESKNQEIEVLENPIDHNEKFKDKGEKITEALDVEKFNETKDQESEVIINDKSVESKDEKIEEHFGENPKNKDQEIQVVEKDVDIKPKEIKSIETEVLQNIVNHTKKSPKNEDQVVEVFDNIFDHKVDDRMLVRSGSAHEMVIEAGNEINVDLKDNGTDLQISSMASYERGINHDLISHHNDFEEVEDSFLPNTSAPVQKDDECKSLSMKSETDDRLEPTSNLELKEIQLLEEISNSNENGVDNSKLLVDKGKEKKIESNINQIVKIKVDPIDKVDVKDEVIKEESIHMSSRCEKHAHIDSVACTHNCENGPSVDEVEPPVMEPLRISEDEEFESKVTETTSSKRSETKDIHIAPKNIPNFTNSVAQHDKSVVRTMNREMDSVTEESEEKSIDGVDEAYEASSDASEDSTPRIRRRTRSLRRSFTYTVLQEASDSDASPEQRIRRIRRTSDVTGLAHLGPSKKRNQSSCLEMANPVSGASSTVQGFQICLSDSALDKREDWKKLTVHTKLGTSSGFASHCESDFSANSERTLYVSDNVDASNASLLTVDVVNKFHTVPSSTTKPSESAGGALIENLGADGTSNSLFRHQLNKIPKRFLSLPPVRRRSIRLLEKTASQQKRQFDDAFGGSDSVSGEALGGRSAGNMKTNVLTRKSVRCTMSDLETVLSHSLQLETENGKANTSSRMLNSSPGSAFQVKDYKTCDHEVENIPSVDKKRDYSSTLSYGVDKNSSFENLSSNNLHNNENSDTCDQDGWVIGKSGNQTEYHGKGDSMAIDILSSSAPQRVEQEQQELTGKISRKLHKDESQKSEDDNLHVVDAEGKSNLSIDIVKDKDHTTGSKDEQENTNNKVKEQKRDLVEIERVEEYLDENEGEELEVLSTSGMEENETPSSSFSANASPSDSEEQRSSMKEKVGTLVSQKSLRSLSSHRSRGRCGKKEVSLDVKRDDIHPSIPPLKVHCVSEAVLAKEVLISPEVSDEECELVSPGVDNDVNEAESFPLPECLETTPKQKSSPITIPSCSLRKKSGGIRSPQKMIPEEQDETTLRRYKVENVSSPSQTPKIKSTINLGMQDKVKSKASCIVGTSDKSMLTRKLSKTTFNEVRSVVLSKDDQLKVKSPARNKACNTDDELSSVDSPEKKLLSNKSKSVVEKATQERPVTKVDLIEDPRITKDLENVVEATLQSVRSTRSSKHKEDLNGSPVTANHEITNNDMVIEVGSSEKTNIISANVHANVSEDSSVHEESGLKLSSVRRKSLEKGFDTNFALEEMIINEKVPLENEHVKKEEKIEQYVETPIKHLTSLSLSMDGPVLTECSSVSFPGLSSIRRSLRLKTSVQPPLPKTHDRRTRRIDISLLNGTDAKESEPVEVLPEKCITSSSLARIDELPSRSGTLITSSSSDLTMKASPRTTDPAASLSCNKNESPFESSSRTYKSPARSSSKKNETQTGSSSKNDESPALSSSENIESVTGISSKNEESAARKFIRCAISPVRSSPRLCWSSSNKDESCLMSTACKEESPVRSSSSKEGSPSRVSSNRNDSVKSTSICKAKSPSSRQDDAFLSKKESPTRLSLRPESPNRSSCNENISLGNSSIRRNQSPRSYLNRNESPLKTSPGKIQSPVISPLSKKQSLARSLDKKDESPAGLSISSDVPQMKSSPKKMKSPISSFSIENESSDRLSFSKDDLPVGSPSLQSKTSSFLSKDKSPTRSSFNILSSTKLSPKHKSPVKLPLRKPPVRSSINKNEPPARSSRRKNESPVRSSASRNQSPAWSSSSESPTMSSSSKNETQTNLPFNKIKSPAKSTSCEDESSASSSLASDSLSGSEPNDEVVADLVGIRSLRRRRVRYSLM